MKKKWLTKNHRWIFIKLCYDFSTIHFYWNWSDFSIEMSNFEILIPWIFSIGIWHFHNSFTFQDLLKLLNWLFIEIFFIFCKNVAFWHCTYLPYIIKSSFFFLLKFKKLLWCWVRGKRGDWVALDAECILGLKIKLKIFKRSWFHISMIEIAPSTRSIDQINENFPLRAILRLLRVKVLSFSRRLSSICDTRRRYFFPYEWPVIWRS